MQRPDEQKSTAILVLGMHRSGTSATTRILNILGAHLGSQLLAPQADNKKGFWEHVEAVDIHERLLSALDRNWHDMREMPAGWLTHPATRLATDEIVELIRRDMCGTRLWAIKDPRMCRLAPLWLEALERLGMRAVAVMVVREPLEVAKSLNVRDGWTHSHAYLMWAQHLLESFRSTMTIPRSLLSYDELMNDWGASFRRIGQELNVSWSRSIDAARMEVDAFVSPEERHHYASQHIDDHINSECPPEFLRRLYESCKCAWRDNHGWDQLTSCDNLYQEIAPLFAEPIGELIGDRQEFERLAVERLLRIHSLEDEYAGSKEDNSRLIAHISRLREDHSNLHENNLKLQEANLQLQEGHLKLQEVHIRVQEDSSKLREENAGLQKDNSKLEAEKSAFQMSATECMLQIQHHEAQQATLEKELENYRQLVRSKRWLLKRLTRLVLQPSTSKQDSNER